MNKMETIEEFYKRNLHSVPGNINTDIGHFNVFKFDEFSSCVTQPVSYNRREYFKIGFIIGRNQIHYADKSIETSKQALLFANPQIPYNWEWIGEEQSGYSCIFTPSFFHHFGNLNDYSVFQSGGTPVLELTDEQAETIHSIFERMIEEKNSDYLHKEDVLRNLVFEVLHYATKLQPAKTNSHKPINASQRVCTLFLELLERQFPIENTNQRLRLHSASGFAKQLAIHVNYLNRSVKEITQKTTSVIIAERILKEAKILLKHSEWNVSEIAYALGFNEVTYFTNFFTKNLSINPTRFRDS